MSEELKRERNNTERTEEELEEFGPDDLELIKRNPAADDDYEEWPEDPGEILRREEQRVWLESLIEEFSFNQPARIVALGPWLAAVIEPRALILVTPDTQKRISCSIDPRGRSDEELRSKIKQLIPFS